MYIFAIGPQNETFFKQKPSDFLNLQFLQKNA